MRSFLLSPAELSSLQKAEEQQVGQCRVQGDGAAAFGRGDLGQGTASLLVLGFLSVHLTLRILPG